MKQLSFSFLFFWTVFTAGFCQAVLIPDDLMRFTQAEEHVKQPLLSARATGHRNPSTAEYTKAPDEPANEGTSVVKLAGDNDLVLSSGNTKSVRYRIDFNFVVAGNKTGSFRLLHGSAHSSSEQGLRVQLEKDGTGNVYANGDDIATFTYNPYSINHATLIEDAEDDLMTLYFHEEEVVSYPMSKCFFNHAGNRERNDPVQRGASDAGKTGHCKILDIQVMQIQRPFPPVNLLTSGEGSNVHLAWEKPAKDDPDGYMVMRDGEVIASGIAGNSFEDLQPYTGSIAYAVRAHYPGRGYSGPAQSHLKSFTGGVERSLVLFEIATGTWCWYCPGSAMGADDIVANALDAAIIEYHGGDSYETNDSRERIDLYAVEGFPSTRVDGILGFTGGNATESMYFYYLDIFNQRKPVPSVHLLNLQISETGDDQFRATIAVEQTDPSITGDLFLHTALTESHIPEVWLGGLTEVNFVCRGMYPSSTGTPLDFSGSNTREVTVDFSTAGLSLRNCEFIAFVQSMPGLEIMQTTRASLRDFDKEISPEAFSIYPNPVNERLTITVNTDEPLSFEITDMLGRIVYPVHEIAGNREVIDVSLWKRGFYIIRTNDGTSKKIVVAGKNISGTP